MRIQLIGLLLFITQVFNRLTTTAEESGTIHGKIFHRQSIRIPARSLGVVVGVIIRRREWLLHIRNTFIPMRGCGRDAPLTTFFPNILWWMVGTILCMLSRSTGSRIRFGTVARSVVCR